MNYRAPLAVLAVLILAAPAVGEGTFPARLETYFAKTLKLTAAERATLLSGKPLAKNLEADPGKEVAVFGAVWISASPAKYVAALEDIENFEKGAGFLATKKVSEPARLEDFARLQLPDDDLKDLRACQVGDCELKLSAAALARVRKEVDWSRPDVRAQVEQLIRRIAVEYVNAYRQGGNSELAVYRDGDKPTFVAEEFRQMVNGMPELGEYLPEMRQYLLDYPRPAPRPTTSFIYWQEAQFGLKPTIRINHLSILQSATGTIIASKQLYASHYFWTALELRALVPDASRGPGFWFVTMNRSRSDGLSGFVGRVIRGKVREAARSGLESALITTKKTMEAR
jgi:hypothetical protein